MPRVKNREILDDLKSHWVSHLIVIFISAMTFVVLMEGGFSVAGIQSAFERGWPLFLLLLFLGFALRFAWQGWITRSD